MLPIPLPPLPAELHKQLLLINSVTLIIYLVILELTASSPISTKHSKQRQNLKPFTFPTILFMVIVIYAAYIQFSGAGI